MQDLPHNRAQCHLCKLYQNLPPRPRRGIHSPRQILLWLRGRHSEQPVSLTGWTHPGHRHTLWLCSPHRISHAASQLTSADLTHHLLLCVCGHECMQKRESECVCACVCVRACVCVCVCVLACSVLHFQDATCVATMFGCCSAQHVIVEGWRAKMVSVWAHARYVLCISEHCSCG